MDHSSTFLGSRLLTELKTGDGMTEREAQDWIAKKAGRSYDAGAMYLLCWPEHEDPKTWGGFGDLRVHVMSDQELIVMEREYRKRHRLPPRRPWEPHMFGSAMGRAER